MKFATSAPRLAVAGLVIALSWMGLADASRAAGTLTVAIPSELKTLDPAKMRTGMEYQHAYMVFSALTQFAPNLDVIPDLAQRWESNEDLTVWTFYLRKGVKFHHGREVDSEDVIATINRILDPEIGSVLKANFEVIESMEAVDKHTVRFNLKLPYAVFPSVFAGYQAGIVPRDKVDELTTHPSGTGPFKFVEYLPGDRVVVEKNPDYFVAGQPKLDRVVMRIIPEAASASAALEAGDVDIYWSLPVEQIDLLESSDTAGVDEVTTGQWYAYVFNLEMAPFDNIKVRQAFRKLVDKPTFTDIAALGHGTPTHTPIAPNHPMSIEAAIDTPDYEGAKKLLMEAGIDPAAMEIDLWAPADSPSQERLAVSFRDSAKNIGIEVNINVAPLDKFYGEIEGKVPFSTTLFYDRIIMDTKLYAWFHSTGSWNNGLWHYKDAKMDELLDGARRTNDEGEMKALYQEVQRKILDEVPGVVVFVLNHANGVHQRVKDFHSVPTMLMNLREVSVQ